MRLSDVAERFGESAISAEGGLPAPGRLPLCGYRRTGPVARMMISAAAGGLFRTHLPPDFAPMSTMLS